MNKAHHIQMLQRSMKEVIYKIYTIYKIRKPTSQTEQITSFSKKQGKVDPKISLSMCFALL